MVKKRTPMNKIKEVLRLKYDCGLSNRNIASCLKLGPSTISELLTRFKQSQLGWPLPESCSDTDISQALYHGKKTSRDKVMPDFTQYAVELRRKGMTKMLLWQEYHEQEQAYAYTQFCEHFTRWFKTQKRSMRQLHVAGDKLFIDYCGPRLQVVNPDTGEVREAEVFVATLGASNYTYVEAFPSQGKSYWLEAHANTFEHFGGAPQLLVPDNLRSAVTKANRYEPRLNDSYQKLANHHQGNLIAQHPRSQRERGNSTQPEHMPSNHQHQKWSPGRLLNWGANIGPATREVVNKMLNSKPHPEQSYRSCLGLLNLSKAHGESRLEQACKDALMLTKTNYTFINNLLKHNREGKKMSKDNTSTPNLVHSNVRGPNCYH